MAKKKQTETVEVGTASVGQPAGNIEEAAPSSSDQVNEEPLPVVGVDTPVPSPKDDKEYANAPSVIVGDSVHYFTRDVSRQYHGDSGPYAAIVTRVHEDGGKGHLDLHVFPAGDLYSHPYDAMGVAWDDGNGELTSWWQARRT